MSEIITSPVTGLTLELTKANRLIQQARLARTLYSFVYGDPNITTDQYMNYMADADEILTSHPHLLGYAGRVDAWYDDTREARGIGVRVLPGA